MIATPISSSAVRAVLLRYDILDTPPEPAFDDLAQRAAEVFGATMAGISFFDTGDVNAARSMSSSDGLGRGAWREWFKSRVNFPVDSMARELSFFLPSASATEHRLRIFVVPDAFADKRFRDHPLVSGPPHICFYAGAAIISKEGAIIGALSVFDTVAREAVPRELEALINLAELTRARLEARAERRLEMRHERQLGGQPGQVKPVPVAPPHSTFIKPVPVPSENTAAQQHIEQSTQKVLRLEQLLEDEIASRKATEDRLRDEKDFSDATIQSLPGAFFMFDADGKMLRWNANFAAITGFCDDDMQQKHALDFVAEKNRTAVADAIRRIFDTGSEVVIEADIRGKSGDETPYSFHGLALDIGGRRMCLGVGRDITERIRAEREVARAKERLDLALAGSNLAIWDWDLTANEVHFSQDWEALLGAKPADEPGTIFSGEEVLAWNHPDDKERFREALTQTARGETTDFLCEYRVPDPHGEWVWMQSKGKVAERAESGLALRMTGTTANITKRKLAEDRVEFLATRDPLTGLPNRMLLNDRLEQGVANAARKKSRLAFMFIDLDRFKTINDSLGHDVGDELLKRVAARLTACIRATDTVARQGGDEFAVILENLPIAESADAQEGAQNVADKMIASMAAPIMINGQHLNTSCSIGISVFPVDGQDPQTLMKHADVAMYDAKAKGRNNYQFFSHEMNARAQERLSIENFLRLALRRDELQLYYQPRVSFLTGHVTGVEALIRWQHPRRGLITPDKFIGVAEDSGLIVPMGEWVIEHAFKQIAEWRERSGRDLKLAVNLSVGQMYDGDRLIRAITASATAANLDPTVVELELTESMLLKNMDETAELLTRLGKLGVGLAIDDFGTGYSSLSYLKQLPVDSIKVDSSFVRDIGTDPNDEAIIRAIIAMTHSLKLNVVAEGVEREDQYRVLRDLECDEYQGYFFSKPLPAAEFEAEFLDLQ
ncbi:MAG: EAL domain-containing protein [Betaproteobacteria bacterium]|nr:EAL domain-containing protein [Betaproteobacteria bacterium]